MFSDSEDASPTKYGGHGLGLALAHRLCSLLGGSISARSKEGEGTRFTILLPTRVEAVPAESIDDEEPEAKAA